MDKEKFNANQFNLKFGTVYQFIVLIAIIGLLGWSFYINKQFNEILLGALIGVMASLPFNQKNDNDKGE